MIPSWNIWIFWTGWREMSLIKGFFGEKSKPKSSSHILASTVERTFQAAEKLLTWSIKSIVNDKNITISEVWKYIEDVKKAVAELLPEEARSNENLNDISYSSYLYWVFKKMKYAWFSLKRKKFKQVPPEHGADVYNILQDKALTAFFMLAKGFWILDFTENNFEIWEKENEIKVLDTSCQEVKDWLTEWGSTDKSLKVVRHRDARIIDHYYDDKNLRLDRQKISWGKRSIRLRTKQYSDGTSEDFYTIKRKITPTTWEENARECYEKEYRVHKKGKFKNFLQLVWFDNSRSKIKDRKSFSIEFEYEWKQVQAKIDIDQYENIPEFIEIECNDNNAIGYIIDKLNLKQEDGSQKDKLIGWSRELFRHYEIYDQYMNHYEVDEETWEVKWSNGEIWNINAAPKSMLAA